MNYKKLWNFMNKNGVTLLHPRFKDLSFESKINRLTEKASITKFEYKRSFGVMKVDLTEELLSNLKTTDIESAEQFEEEMKKYSPEEHWMIIMDLKDAKELIEKESE